MKTYPLSQSQLGIYSDWILNPESTQYNLPIVLHLSSDINAERMQEAIRKLISIFPIFRTRIIEIGNELRQYSDASMIIEVPIEDVPKEEIDNRINRFIRPFNIMEEPLSRFLLIRSSQSLTVAFDVFHIINDGITVTGIINYMNKFYLGNDYEDKSISLYAYAEEESESFLTPQYEQAALYYRNKFEGVKMTELPGRINNDLGKTLLKSSYISRKEVDDFCSLYKVSADNLLMAAYEITLSRFCREKNIAYTSVNHGRLSRTIRKSLGMFVKSVPILAKTADNIPVLEFIMSHKLELFSTIKNGIYPFTHLCQDLGLHPSLSFGYQGNAIQENFIVGGEPCEALQPVRGESSQDISVVIYETDASYELRIKYVEGQYKASYISMLANCMVECVKSILSAPEATLKDISVVSDHDKQHLITLGKGDALDYDQRETFIDLFQKQVVLYPDNIAVVDEASRITYRELDHQSDVLAGILSNKGVTKDHFVAIMLPRRKEFMISVLAVFKSGGAYIPLDSDYPNERLQYMLEDSESKVLITTCELLEEKRKSGEFAADNILLIEEVDLSASAVPVNLAEPKSLAYMIYTSGSTGKPKGVMVEHKSLNAFVRWRSNRLELNEADHIAQHASFSFDASLDDLMTPLTVGAEVHILASSLRQDMDGMYRYFVENKISGMTLSTQLGMEMLNAYELPLRYLMMGGEKLKPTKPSSVKVINGYGPTEFTVCSSYHVIDSQCAYHNIPIGRPVPNTASYIVDDNGHLLPAGVAGELCLVGNQMARGYWKREDLTSEKFSDCSFLEGEKMYHTGDLARWNENGELEYLGRIDNQVKLRGFRIEMGEIECAISRFEGIESAVAEVKELNGVQQLCTYYTASTAINEKLLHYYLASVLTDYMVPSSYTQLESIPLTPNGKVDRKKLPVPQIKAEEIVPPADNWEEVCFKIVSEQLHITEFGVTTNLISVGLTSMGAIKLSLAVKKYLALELKVKNILSHPTIRAWKALAEQEKTPIKAYSKQTYYPLTENQTGIYIDWEQHRDGLQYNVPMAFRMKEVEVNRLKSALEEVIVAHPNMKTHIEMQDSGLCQHRRDESTIEIIVQTLDTEPDKAFFQSRVRPFNILEDDLCRIEIYRYINYTYLFIDIHHIIYDGGSVNIIMRDLEAAYTGNELQPEQFTAFDYSLYYSAWKESSEYTDAEVYYNTLLDGIESVQYPLSSENEAEEGSRNLSVSLDRTGVTKLSKQLNVTENSVWMAAFTQLLHRITREDKLAITTISNGRSITAMSNTMGMFVQTLPLVSHNENHTIAESIRLMHQQLLETIDREKYPFTRLVEQYGIHPDIMVVYQGDVLDKVGSFTSEMEPISLELNTVKAPLSLNIMPSVQDVELLLEYDAMKYARNDMQQLADSLKNFMIAIANSDIEQQWSSVSVVSDDQQQELIALGKGDVLDYDQNENFIDLFKKQVTLYPDNIAVVDEASRITYRELDSQSDVLAHILLDKGVAKDSFVCVMLPRRKEFLVSILGIFKAGGAYIPLDSDYPNERLQYMLEDSASNVLITTKELLDEKRKSGEFSADNILLIEEVDLSASAVPVNLAEPKSLAYMIYTSGSTGNPKGVMVEHKSLNAFVRWCTILLELSETDHIAQHASFSFDASLVDLMTPLTVGAEVHILASSLRQDMDGMYRYFVENKISGMTLSTQLGMEMLNAYELPLRYLMMGGEKLKPTKPSSVKVINGYGPTEFTVCSSYHVIDPQCTYRNIPIGRPVPNTASYIVDGGGHLLPAGVAGELCLVGNQMARGYWKREDLTSEKFTACPFLEGEKMYHTGDLARWNENGELEYLGRIDNQVKLRGFRIEMGEIESAILRFDEVESAVAEVKELNGVQQLCAYYTTSTAIDEQLLRYYLASVLTDYMVPNSYTQLESMPLTPNGKVDRKNLPIPKLSRQTVYEAPSNEKEQLIADLFASVLNFKDPIGVNDGFFALGGDSIKAIRLVSMLRQHQMIIAVADVMKYKTVKAIAAVVSAEKQVEVEQSSWSGAVKNTPIQSFFFELNLPIPSHFNQSVILRSPDRINTNILDSTIQTLVTHHDMLRAVCTEQQLFVRPATSDNLYTLVECDLQQEDHPLSVLQKKADELQSSINLQDGPLLKVCLFRLADFDALLIVVHHLVVDGVSWRIIMEDLNSLYEQLQNRKTASLPLKTHSYRDWSEALHKYRASDTLSTEMKYWKNIYRKMQKNNLCTSTASCVRPMCHLQRNLEQSVTNKLRGAASDAYGTTVDDLLLTALGLAYRRITDKSSVSIQLEGHGRESIGEPILIDRTVGWFTSAYPVVLDNLSDDIRYTIREVKETLRRIPNKGVGYGVLQYIGESPFEKHVMPLVGFNYLGDFSENSESMFFTLANDLPQGTSISPLNMFGPSISLNAVVVAGSLVVSFDYDPSVWNEKQAVEMADDYIEELQKIVQHTTSKSEREYTASDFGGEMNDKQFEALYNYYKSKNEPIERIYPLTPMQQAMLLTFVNDPEAIEYRLLSRFTLNRMPTADQLAYALSQLALKHEVLRTSILYDGVDDACQAILNRKLTFEMMDISQSEDIEKSLDDIQQQLLHRRLDLQRDPLFNVLCIKCSENSCKLLFLSHHIIMDGWCISIYKNDFAYFLQEAIEGKCSVVTSDSGRYEKFVRELIAKDRGKGLAYWKNLLDGYDEKASIPTYESITTENRSAVNCVMNELDEDTFRKLSQLCSDEQITINTAVELAWGLVLQLYMRKNDAVFVKVVSGRDKVDFNVEDVVGLFINSVPVRIQSQPSDSFRKMLINTQHQAADSNRFDYCSLSDIQQQNPLGVNLFQSLLVFENYLSDEKISNEKTFSLTIDTALDKADEEISVLASIGKSLILQIKFDTNRYQCSEMKTIMDVFVQIVRYMAENPDKFLSDIPIIDGKTQDELIALGSGEVLDYDKSKTLIDLFKKQATLYPDNIAVVDEASRITYRELDSQSDVLAHILLDKGVAKDSFACVMLPRRKEFLVSILGIFKAGGAYIPLDSDYPNERLQYMLEDSASNVLITTKELLDEKRKSGEFTADNILLIEEVDLSASAVPVNLAEPKSLAYMIYTSGSTGNPKGVMVEHKSLNAFVRWRSNRLELSEADHIAQHASFSFDASLDDLMTPLTVGAEVHILASSLRQDMDGMYRYFVENKISGMTLSTQLGMEMLNAYELPLRYLMMGGEKLKPTKPSSVKVINGYGPTEFTVCSSYHVIDPQYTYRNIPIGRPVPNTASYIVDNNGHLLPVGVAGELCLVGNQMARGYWKREDLTSEKFSDCSFLEGEKMYHTGDLARWNKNGELEYLGRIDNQVKLRGFRIEMGEIESAISRFDGITSTAALVHTKGTAQFLMAFYTANEEINKEALSQYLESSLTDYMVPQQFVQLAELPLTPNGKVDKKTLVKMSDEMTFITSEMVLPQNAKEEIVYSIAKEILDYDRFGVTDNLMQIGLTSLAAIKLVAKVAERGIKLKVNDVMKCKTIRKMLVGNKAFGYWANTYSDNKPIVVVIQALSTYVQVTPLIEKLSESYSIFAFESLFDHYQYLFKGESKSEVINMYYSFFDYFLPKNRKPFAVIGHSYGGELAYRMVAKIQEMRGYTPKAVLFDTYADFDNKAASQIKEKVVHTDTLSEELDETIRMNEILRDLDDGVQLPNYQGEVLFFNALKQRPSSVNEFNDIDEFENKHSRNVANWKQLVPNIQIVDIDGNHSTIMEEQFMDFYIGYF